MEELDATPGENSLLWLAHADNSFTPPVIPSPCRLSADFVFYREAESERAHVSLAEPNRFRACQTLSSPRSSRTLRTPSRTPSIGQPSLSSCASGNNFIAVRMVYALGIVTGIDVDEVRLHAGVGNDLHALKGLRSNWNYSVTRSHRFVRKVSSSVGRCFSEPASEFQILNLRAGELLKNLGPPRKPQNSCHAFALISFSKFGSWARASKS